MLETVKQKITRLIAAYETEKTERTRLSSELEQSKILNEIYRKRISELERQIDNLKLTEAFMGTGTDNSQAKNKIDSIIKESDRCIALIQG